MVSSPVVLPAILAVPQQWSAAHLTSLATQLSPEVLSLAASVAVAVFSSSTAAAVRVARSFLSSSAYAVSHAV